jgi:hypothetical protein
MNKFLLTIYKLNVDGYRIKLIEFNIVNSDEVQVNQNYYELKDRLKYCIGPFKDYDLEPLTKERIDRLINLHKQKKNNILTKLASIELLLQQLNSIKKIC